jgi:hypothetical protein
MPGGGKGSEGSWAAEAGPLEQGVVGQAAVAIRHRDVCLGGLAFVQTP